MIRADKVTAVERMSELFASAPHVILANFSGLRVNQANELRSRVRDIGGRLTVVKNRLARRAAAGTAVGHLAEHLTGPCVLATHESDPVALAKALSDFSKDNPELKVLAAVIDGRDVMAGEGVKRLAALPGLLQLRALLLAVVQAPAGQLVRLLSTPGAQLARVLDARREQLERGA